MSFGGLGVVVMDLEFSTGVRVRELLLVYPGQIKSYFLRDKVFI